MFRRRSSRARIQHSQLQRCCVFRPRPVFRLASHFYFFLISFFRRSPVDSRVPLFLIALESCHSPRRYNVIHRSPVQRPFHCRDEKHTEKFRSGEIVKNHFIFNFQLSTFLCGSYVKVLIFRLLKFQFLIIILLAQNNGNNFFDKFTVTRTGRSQLDRYNLYFP